MQFGGWGVGEAVVRKKNCKEMAMDEFVVNKGLRHGNSGGMRVWRKGFGAGGHCRICGKMLDDEEAVCLLG